MGQQWHIVSRGVQGAPCPCVQAGGNSDWSGWNMVMGVAVGKPGAGMCQASTCAMWMPGRAQPQLLSWPAEGPWRASASEEGQRVLAAEEVASAPPERWAQVHPHRMDRRVVLEEPVPPAGGSAGLSQTEAQELLWGAEGDVSPAQPPTLGRGETERYLAVLERAGHLSGGLAPTGSQGQAVEERGQHGKSTLEQGL